MKSNRLSLLVCSGASLLVASAAAADTRVDMYRVDEKGAQALIGTVTVTEGSDGLTLTPDLKGLAPGDHGFHIHQNPSCDPAEKAGVMTAAEAAGGHLDPQKVGKHEGPSGAGHLGDLPALKVAQDGTAKEPVKTSKLKLEQILNHSLIVHAGGDNYSDAPKPNGGGGDRVACGVVKAG